MSNNQIRARLLACVAVVMTTVAAAAADLDVSQPVAAAEALPDPSHKFDLVFGLAAVSDFVTRGYSKSQGDPAVQGYVDAYFGPFYAGVWASNVDFGSGRDGAEIDAYAGILQQIGILSVNVGYVHYNYAPSSAARDYEEVYSKVYAAVHKSLTLGGQVFHSWDMLGTGTTATYVEANASYKLPHDFSISGAVGRQSLDALIGPDYTTWNIGLTWRPKPWLGLDIRYYDTDHCAVSICDQRVVGSVSLTGSLSALKKLSSAP